MDATNGISRIADQPVLDAIAEPLSRASGSLWTRWTSRPTGQECRARRLAPSSTPSGIH